MLFNSIDFAIFLPLVFFLYWFVFTKKLKHQNLLILLVSYYFYGFWDIKFLGLLVFSSVLDFFIGVGLSNTHNGNRRKILIALSICLNLGLLMYFKYFNFFIESFESAFTFFGYHLHCDSLNIVLPVGISFYTFQTMSYSIDVYRKDLIPSKDFIAFSAYVSFFPQLVAGPIERATHLLPQFDTKRTFDSQKAFDGMRQILWGLFKKIVIADNCADCVNLIFNQSDSANGSTLMIGALLFSFQIYGDFSGYSDIAIGTSRLFGFDLMRNFHFPYFSKNVTEFWRNWHISLTTWFRDYVYIPLGGSKVSLGKKIRNTLIVFLISGFWHGANWTFIFWGLVNALFLMPSLIFKKSKPPTNLTANLDKFNLKQFISIVLTFILISFSWILFRSESMGQALIIISEIFSPSLFYFPNHVPEVFLFVLLIVFIVIEWQGKTCEFAIQKLSLNWSWYYRYGFYYLIAISIFWFGGSEQQFIYFQF